MKKLIVSLATVLATGLAPAFAHTTNDNPRAEKVFAQQFAGAENVKWTELSDDYVKASFTLSGIRVEAYFNQDGELEGTLRNLFYNQLPLAVMQTVSHKFTGAVIVEIKEITNNESTSYRIVLELKNTKYNLKLNSFGEITEQEREKIKLN